MIIKLYYECKGNVTILEVPDDECEIMVETDYQQRLASTEDKASVHRRTAQEIMDEDLNKPTFNNHQRETRRHIATEVIDPDGRHISGGLDPLTALIRDEQFEELRQAIERLQPQQKELVRRVFWADEKQADIAREQGVSKAALTARMKKIYATLKKLL